MSKKPYKAEFYKDEAPRIRLCEHGFPAGSCVKCQLKDEVDRLRAWKEKVGPLGYLASIAAATPEQLDELRELCRPQEGV